MTITVREGNRVVTITTSIRTPAIAQPLDGLKVSQTPDLRVFADTRSNTLTIKPR